MEKKVGSHLQGRKEVLIRSVGNGSRLFKLCVIGGIVIYFVYCPGLRNTNCFHRMGLSPRRNHCTMRKPENSKKQQAEGELPERRWHSLTV